MQQLKAPLTDWKWWLFDNSKLAQNLTQEQYIRVIAYAREDNCYHQIGQADNGKLYVALTKSDGTGWHRVREDAAMLAVLMYKCGIRIDATYTSLGLAELGDAEWEALKVEVDTIRARNKNYPND